MENSERKRPVWVWIISLFYGSSVGWTLFSFFLVQAGRVPLTPEQELYFNNLTALDYLITIAIGTLNFSGAIALFKLMRIAFYLFTSALAVNLLYSLWTIATTGWVEAIGNAGFVGSLFGWALAIAICIYTWRLTQREILT